MILHGKLLTSSCEPLLLPMVHGGGGSMENRKRNHMLVIGAAVLYILLGNMIGFFTVTALIVFWLAVAKFRSGDNRLGCLLTGIGLVMLIHEHFILVLMLAIVCLVFFYMKSRQAADQSHYLHKQNILHSMKKGDEQYALYNMSVWSVINEVNLDLSYAILEENETTVLLQGVIGDIDLLVPADMAVSIDANVVIGEVNISREHEAGMMCRVKWRSFDYDVSEQKLNVICSFVVGDINVKVL